ncbi:MAG: DUF4105 domain-containing protein [Leptospiraceae bacterium]|nr:DUF4105 domain-containing protein [Leptospiraceae bacterium]
MGLLLLTAVRLPQTNAVLTAQAGADPEAPEQTARPVLTGGLAFLRQLDKSTDLAPGAWSIPRDTGGQRYRVDVITIEPGDVIFFAWGHTALRIYDSQTGRDFMFDYGLFEFDDTFVYRFLQGRPAFMVGGWQTAVSLGRYVQDNRRIFGQQLLITDARAADLMAAMLLNIRPENRNFLYHHYRDNCTTRVRDRVDEVLDGALQSYFTAQKQPRTWRASSMELLGGRPFLWYGTNLLLGSLVDAPVDQWQHQYLPLNLMAGLAAWRDAGHADQVGAVQIWLNPLAGGFTVPWTPWIWFLLFWAVIGFGGFIAPLIWIESRWWNWLGRLAWLGWNSLAGLTGLLITLMWWFTDHDSVFHNANLMGYSPLLLLIIPLSLVLRSRSKFRENTALHRILIAPPLVGFLMSLTGLIHQWCWPFLLVATIVQALVYVRFLFRERQLTAILVADRGP